jgi:hypothetical protein
MLNAMTGFYDRAHIDEAAAARTIVIDTGTVRATDFGLDREAQDLLFRKGREAALAFLDGAPGQPGWDWEACKRTYRSSQSPVMSFAAPARDALRSLRHRVHRRTQNRHRTLADPAAPLRPAATSQRCTPRAARQGLPVPPGNRIRSGDLHVLADVRWLGRTRS